MSSRRSTTGVVRVGSRDHRALRLLAGLRTLGPGLARARARLLREGLDPGPPPDLAPLSPPGSPGGPGAEIIPPIGSRQPPGRAHRRHLTRAHLLLVLHEVETDSAVVSARQRARDRVDSPRATREELAAAHIALAATRDRATRALVQQLERAELRELPVTVEPEELMGFSKLLLCLAGMKSEELERLRSEEREALGRQSSISMLEELCSAPHLPSARDEPGDASSSERPSCGGVIRPRLLARPSRMGEFLGRLDLASFWNDMVYEQAPGAAGAEALPLDAGADVRILTGEQDGLVDARAFLAALGAALHDCLRSDACFVWAMQEAGVLRCAMAEFFARYVERAGWLLAHGELGYEAAVAEQRCARLDAARRRLWHGGIAGWEEEVISLGERERERGAPGRFARRIACWLGSDESSATATQRAALRDALVRPALVSWLADVVADNLVLDLVLPAGAAIVDNPRVGRLLADLVAHDESDPWEVRLEVLRGAPLSGAPTWLIGHATDSLDVSAPVADQAGG